MPSTIPIDEKAFRLLFDQYKNRLYGYVLTIAKDPVAAEEITQEIFIKLWVSRDLLAEVSNMEGYLFTVARNRTLNYLRKAANDSRFLSELKSYMEDSAAINNIDERIATENFRQLVTEAVEQLSPQRRKVYELSRHQGMSLEQIAAVMQLSRNTVKNHLVSALSAIRDHLAERDSGLTLLLLFLVH